MSKLSQKRSAEDSDDDSRSGHFVRAGKWSQQEESYANRLVYEFERGSLIDCEQGCTLRSYLARKLKCAPMRISKKFAGRCIGKMAFVKKPIDQESLKTILIQLEDLEIQSSSFGSHECEEVKSKKKCTTIHSTQPYGNLETSSLFSALENTAVDDKYSEKTDTADEKDSVFSVCDFNSNSSLHDVDSFPLLYFGDSSNDHVNHLDYIPTIQRGDLISLVPLDSLPNSSEVSVDPQDWQELLSYFSGDDSSEDVDINLIRKDCCNNPPKNISESNLNSTLERAY